MSIRYGRLGAPPPTGTSGDGASTAVAWHFMPHAQFDGLGALAELLVARGASLRGGIPTARGLSAAALPRRLTAFARILGASTRGAAVFRDHDMAWPVTPGASSRARPHDDAVAWRCFSREDTQTLLAAARADGVTLNSLLLWALHRAVAPELVGDDALWVVPVNLRGLVQHARDTANHIAFLQVRVTTADAPRDVHATVSGAFDADLHWGAWTLANLGALLGARNIERVARAQDTRSRAALGAFSNLGALEGDDDAAWMFAPPVSLSQPLGAGALTWNGRLTLVLQLHPSHTRAREASAAMLRRWCEAVGGVR